MTRIEQEPSEDTLAPDSGLRLGVYDRGVISAEYDGDDVLVARYVHTPSTAPFAFREAAALADLSGTMANAGLTHILEMERGGQRYFQLSDALGSTTALTTHSGTIAERNGYDSYGNPSTPTTTGNPFAFTGVLHEPTTALYLMPLRAYDPALGRFLSEDPVPAVNGYVYVENDPANLIDPTGARPLIEFPYITAVVIESIITYGVPAAGASVIGTLCGAGAVANSIGTGVAGTVAVIPALIGRHVGARWAAVSGLTGTAVACLGALNGW